MHESAHAHAHARACCTHTHTHTQPAHRVRGQLDVEDDHWRKASRLGGLYTLGRRLRQVDVLGDVEALLREAEHIGRGHLVQ